MPNSLATLRMPGRFFLCSADSNLRGPVLGDRDVPGSWLAQTQRATSFMVGTAAEKHPDLAREIVRRGHEAAAHGRTWESTFQLSRADEKKNIADGVEIIERITPSAIQRFGKASHKAERSIEKDETN